MKKLLRNLSVLCFVLAAFLTTGCYEEEIPFLKADHEVVLVGPETGKGTVVIESNLQWTASSDVEWITVDNGFGNHKGTFEFFVAANTTPNERSGKITITSNDGIVSTTVLVRQTSEGTQLVLGKDAVSFTKYAGEYLMSIACNGPWEVASSADWCTVDPTSGDGNGAFKITVEENNTGADRVATITVLTEADGKTEVHQIEVSQSASNAALVVSPESQTLTAEAGQFTLNVATVGTWTASVDSDWIVLSETEGTGDNLITVTASANDTGRERIAVITFTTGPENENRITRQIVVRQAAVDFYLDVPVTDYPLSVEEQTIEIPYVLEGSNVTVTASSSSKWMTVESVADGVATVKVAENTTAIAREGVISFITHGQAGDPIIRQVRVAQAPTINILDVLADEYAVEWVGETFRIPIYSNTPVSARSSEPWCNVVADGQNLVITVEKNETAVPRVAVVTVTTDSEKGEIISKTTIIRQGAAYSTLVVSPAEKNLYAIAQNFVASILTNNSWTASSDSDWLTIDKTEGTGDYMLNVNVAENKTGQVRVAVITIQTGAENSQRESATITVTQRPEQFYFEVPVRSFLFDKWGGPAKVTFITSGNEESVVASSNVDWLRVGDMEDGFVNVAVQENKTAEVRTGVVTITCTPVFGDPIAIPVTFTQSPTVNILDVFVDVIDVMARGDEVALPYYANTPVSVSSSEEWCHVSVGVDEDSYTAECCSYSDPQKIIKIEVDPNRTGEARVAFVTIATVNDAGEKITKVITIRQAALYAALSVTPKEVVIPATETEFAMTINTTGTWWATNSSNWLTNPVEGGVSTEAAGFGDAVINWTAAENTTGYDRRAQITVATGPENNEREEQVVNVIQLARDTYIEIPIAAYAVTKEQQTLAVGYYAAGDFTDMQVNCSEDWIQYTGGDDKTLNFAIAENTTAEPRTAVVTVTLQLKAGEPISDTFIVTQAPTINILDVYVDYYEASPWGEEVVLPFYGNTEVGVSVSAMQSGWCKVLYGTPNQDVDPQEIVIGISKNEDAEARTAYVTLTTVTEKGEKLTHIITIHQNPLNATLMVSPEKVVLPAHNASFWTQVVTSGTWDLDWSMDWLEPVDYDGEGDETVNWDVDDNDTGLQREATIIIFTGAENETRVEKRVQVIQLAADTYLDIPMDNFVVSKEQQNFHVVVFAAGDITNSDWDCSALWLEVTEFNLESGMIGIAVQENTTAEPRTATVTVTIERAGGEPYTDSFTVTQAGTYNVLDGLSDRVSVLPVDDTIKIPVITNVKTLRAVASENWLTSKVDVDENFDIATVELYAAANTTGKDRHASLTLITETDKGQTLEKKIMVFQPAADTYFAILSGENVLVTKVASDITVSAYASVNADKVTMISNAPWITVKTEPEATDQIVNAVFTVAENTTGERRQGEIIVTFFDEKGDTVQKTIVVNQAATDGGELEALVDFITVDALGETVVLTFETEDALTAIPSAEWITEATIANNTDPQTLKIVAAANTTGKDRTAYITVSNGSESKIITVFQPAKDTYFAVRSGDVIYIDNKEQEVAIEGYANVNAESVVVASDAAWLTKDGDVTVADQTNWTAKMKAAKNNSADSRTATVKVSYIDEKGQNHEKTVTVIQNGGSLTPAIDYIVVDPAGEEQIVQFNYTGEIAIGMGTAPWLANTVATPYLPGMWGFVTIKAEPNETGLDRLSSVQILSDDNIIAVINVFQPAQVETEPVFAVLTPETVQMSKDEQEFEIIAYGSDVDAVEDIAMVPSASWLTAGEKTISDKMVTGKFTAAKNNSAEERTATVKVTYIDAKGATQTAEVTVIQGGATLTPALSYIAVDPAGDEQIVQFNYSGKIAIGMGTASWLANSVATWGIAPDWGFVTIKAEPNNTGRDRESSIQILSDDNLIAVITVFQPAAAAADVEFKVLDPTIAASSAEQYVYVAAYGSTGVTVENISASENEDWIAVATPDVSGDPIAKFKVKLTANTTGDVREGVIRIDWLDSANKLHSDTATITQSPTENILDVYISNWIVPYFEVEDRLPIFDNATKVIARSSNPNWLYASIVTDADNNTRDVKVKITENETGEPRRGVVTINATFADGTKAEKVINVIQLPKDEESTPVPTAENYLFLAVDDVTLPAEASEETVNVFTNATNYTVEADAAATWLTATKGSVKLAAEANTGAERTAVVTVTATYADGTTESKTMNVTQLAPEALIHYLNGPKEFIIDNDHTGGMLMTLNTDALKDELSVTVPSEASSWLTVEPYEDAVLLVTPTENTALESREATVTVTATYAADGETADIEIKVIQSPAAEKYLYVQEVVYRKQIDAAVTEVPVFTNLTGLTFEVTEGAAWITIPTSSDAKFSVKTADNETGAARTGKIKVSKGDKSAEVIVKQAYGSEDPNYFAISSEVVIDQETTISFPVHTNAINLEATVPTSCDWLSSPLISQEGDNWIITFKPVADKYYTSDKQVNISVKATYQSGSPLTETKTVTVKRQKDDLPYLDMPLQYFVPSGKVTVSTYANTNGTLSLQSTPASWCTVTITGTDVRIQTEANPETTQRSTQFTLVSTLGGGAGVTTKSVTVIQLGKVEPAPLPGYIECNLGVVEEGPDPATVEVPFQTDAVSYTVSTSDSWITISDQSPVESEAAQFTVNLPENTGKDTRVGVVKVTATFADSSTKNYYLPVIQSAHDYYFDVLTSNYELDFYTAGSVYVPFISDEALNEGVNLTVEIDAEHSSSAGGYGYNWIQLHPTIDNAHNQIKFNLRENNTRYARTGTIKLTYSSSKAPTVKIVKIVTILQPRNPNAW